MTTQGRELTRVRTVDVQRQSAPLRGASGGRVQRIEGPASKAQELKAELARRQQRGEIAYAFNYSQTKAMVSVYVELVREPRSKTPWYIAGFTAAFGALVGVGALLYASRYVLLAVAGIALLVLLGIKMATHQSACECIIHRH